VILKILSNKNQHANGKRTQRECWDLIVLFPNISLLPCPFTGDRLFKDGLYLIICADNYLAKFERKYLESTPLLINFYYIELKY
jgi:uncharacterized membrane protein